MAELLPFHVLRRAAGCAPRGAAPDRAPPVSEAGTHWRGTVGGRDAKRSLSPILSARTRLYASIFTKPAADRLSEYLCPQQHDAHVDHAFCRQRFATHLRRYRVLDLRNLAEAGTDPFANYVFNRFHRHAVANILSLGPLGVVRLVMVEGFTAKDAEKRRGPFALRSSASSAVNCAILSHRA